jgi:hypothetical protein
MEGRVYIIVEVIMKAIQPMPDGKAVLKSGTTVTPILTLIDHFGGKSHIVVDDACYVLVNGNDRDGFDISSHWYQEAISALRVLPENPTTAITACHREVLVCSE